MEIYHVNKVLAFVLPMGSMDCLLFIHHMTFSLIHSYHRPILGSKFRVYAIYSKKQFCLHTVHVPEFAFKMNVQLRLGFRHPIPL